MKEKENDTLLDVSNEMYKQKKIVKHQKKQIKEQEEFYEMLDEIQDDNLYQMMKKLK